MAFSIGSGWLSPSSTIRNSSPSIDSGSGNVTRRRGRGLVRMHPRDVAVRDQPRWTPVGRGRHAAEGHGTPEHTRLRAEHQPGIRERLDTAGARAYDVMRPPGACTVDGRSRRSIVVSTISWFVALLEQIRHLEAARSTTRRSVSRRELMPLCAITAASSGTVINPARARGNVPHVLETHPSSTRCRRRASAILRFRAPACAADRRATPPYGASSEWSGGPLRGRSVAPPISDRRSARRGVLARPRNRSTAIRQTPP